MTATKIRNSIYYVVCLIVAITATLPPTWQSLIPAPIAPYIIGGVLVAAWAKAHWNLFVNPDGTPAEVAYVTPQETAPDPPKAMAAGGGN